MPGGIGAHFTWLDWCVVFGYLGLTTLVGACFAGRQATFRDFFLGGRKLPWYAVTGSMIATEISAVTFVSLPWMVYRDGGNLTYLQLGLIGSLIGRAIVAFVLVPAYYEREIYSPYDYMGHRLGESARTVTSVLFAVGGVLGQSARVYLTAIVLDLLLRDSALGMLAEATGISTMTWAIWILGAVAVAWTLLGGITTVIWTDVMLFLVFMIGALVALVYIIASLDGGARELVEAGRAAGKFRLVDFSVSPAAPFTVWTALFAISFLNIHAFGANQLNAQRIFCCAGPRAARRAVLASYAGMMVTVTIMLVGIGLYAFHRAHPLTGEAAELVAQNGERVFPIFIITELPAGLTGLLIAGVFAAAISSLDSILIALSQTTMMSFVAPIRARWHHRRTAGLCNTARQESAGDIPDLPPPMSPSATSTPGEGESAVGVRASRVLVVFWGVVLCLLAQLAAGLAEHFRSVLELALAMDTYAAGALVAAFGLAFLPVRATARGLCWAAPLAVAMVFAIAWHEVWARTACTALAVVLAALWIGLEFLDSGRRRLHIAWRTTGLAAGLAMLLFVSFFHWRNDQGGIRYLTLAWPWNVPIGAAVTFIWTLWLGGRRTADDHPDDAHRRTKAPAPSQSCAPPD